MKKFNTIVTGKIPIEWAGPLTRISNLTIWPGGKNYLMPRDELISLLPKAHAVVNFAEVKADHDLLTSAPKLKILANASIGFDNFIVDELTKRGIWATNSPGFFHYPVAEYIIGGMINLSRKLGEAERFVRLGAWRSFEPGRWDGISLRGRSIGIVGMGAIGVELAKLAICFGMEVRFFDLLNKSLPGFTAIDELLALSDFVSVNVPLNAKTFKMVDGSFIGKLRKDAILINTSRGAIVDQTALTEALTSGRIGGAILDVFENEPEVPEKVKKLENVILTPHMAGGTVSSRKSSTENAFKNVYLVLTGGIPLNPVNKINK